jgi:hypothetical protein
VPDKSTIHKPGANWVVTVAGGSARVPHQLVAEVNDFVCSTVRLPVLPWVVVIVGHWAGDHGGAIGNSLIGTIRIGVSEGCVRLIIGAGGGLSWWWW